MTEKNTWEIENMKQRIAEQERRSEDTEKRVRDLESFKDATVEKLISIFRMLEELREGDRWIKRMFTTSLVTAIVGAVITLILRFM